jgi:hypothetical protein
MDTPAIQLPFELSFNNIPINIKENYCCTVDFPNEERKEHYHMSITYLEIQEEYKIIQFDRDKSDYTTMLGTEKWYNWFSETLYPIVVMANTDGGIIEVCNREEISQRIECLFKKLNSPYISNELQLELVEHYRIFGHPDAILSVTKEPFIQLVLFPLYTGYTEPVKYFINEFTDGDELHKFSFSAKLFETLDQLGHIKVEIIGLYNQNSNFHHDATYTFDSVTHVFQTIEGEIIQQNDEPVIFNIVRLIAD